MWLNQSELLPLLFRFFFFVCGWPSMNGWHLRETSRFVCKWDTKFWRVVDLHTQNLSSLRIKHTREQTHNFYDVNRARSLHENSHENLNFYSCHESDTLDLRSKQILCQNSIHVQQANNTWSHRDERQTKPSKVSQDDSFQLQIVCKSECRSSNMWSILKHRAHIYIRRKWSWLFTY